LHSVRLIHPCDGQTDRIAMDKTRYNSIPAVARKKRFFVIWTQRTISYAEYKGLSLVKL